MEKNKRESKKLPRRARRGRQDAGCGRQVVYTGEAPAHIGMNRRHEVVRHSAAELGTRLVEYAIEWLKSKGCKGCGGFLDRDYDNMDARARFFKRLGFVVPPSNTTIKKPFE